MATELTDENILKKGDKSRWHANPSYYQLKYELHDIYQMLIHALHMLRKGGDMLSSGNEMPIIFIPDRKAKYRIQVVYERRFGKFSITLFDLPTGYATPFKTIEVGEIYPDEVIADILERAVYAELDRIEKHKEDH